MLCDLKLLAGEGQRDIRDILSVTMASEDIGDAVGRATVVDSALSAGSRNNHVTSDYGMPLSQSNTLPHSHQPEVSHQGSGDCCSPLPLYWKLSYDSGSYDSGEGTFLDAGCKCWECSNPKPASAVAELSTTSQGERGTRALGSSSTQLCPTCDPVESLSACQEADSVCGTTGTETEPRENQSERRTEGFSSPGVTPQAGALPKVSYSEGSPCQLEPSTAGTQRPCLSAVPCRRSFRRSSLPVASQCHFSCSPIGEGGTPGMPARTIDARCWHFLKDGYSSLERLNRRPRAKVSVERFFRRASLDTMLSTSKQSTSPQKSDSDGGLSDSEFIRNRKERSTVLVRRYYKNNRKVEKSVRAGTKAIMRFMLSGHIAERAWEAVCKRTWHPSERPIVSVRGHGAGPLAVSLRGYRGLLRYTGARLSEVSVFVFHTQATGFLKETSVVRALCSCSSPLLSKCWFSSHTRQFVSLFGFSNSITPN